MFILKSRFVLPMNDHMASPNKDRVVNVGSYWILVHMNIYLDVLLIWHVPLVTI